jgi:hypothetical protein
LELVKLGETMDTKFFKILNNVKICWISMLNPFRWILQEYCPLLSKMALNHPKILITISNLENFADVETFLNLAYIVLLLNVVKNLIKLAQA